MTTELGTNYNYQSILQQIQGVLNQSVPESSEEIFDAGKFFEIGNILNGSKIGNYSNGSGSSVAQGVVSNILSLISSIANQASEAADEAKQKEQAVSKLEKENAKKKVELINQITEIGDAMGDAAEVASSTVTSLQQLQEELNNKQEELQEYIEKINAEQEALASSNDPNEKQAHLNQIIALSQGITELVNVVAEYQTQVTNLSTEMEKANQTMEELKGNSVEIQEVGEADIQDSAQKAAGLIQDNVQMKTKSIVNEKTGDALEVKAGAASSNIFTAGASVELYKLATDNFTAGTIRSTSSMSNLRQVYQGIGALSNNTQILASFDTAIGNINNQFNGYIGNWNSILEPTITSIGSWKEVEANNAVLSKGAEADIKRVQGDASVEQYQSKNPDNTTGLQTVDFDITLLNPFDKKPKMGI